MAATSKPMSSIGFKLMSLLFKVRDVLRPRRDVLKEVGIKPGDSVLDFGCGPGGYIMPLARLVGPSGKIYALDMHPLAIRSVQQMANREGMANVKTIESDGGTGLPDNSMDIVLLYDVFHGLARPDDVLKELHRVLKRGGILSFSDHHMKEEEVPARLTGTGLFQLAGKGRSTHSFLKTS